MRVIIASVVCLSGEAEGPSLYFHVHELDRQIMADQQYGWSYQKSFLTPFAKTPTMIKPALKCR